MKEKNCKIVQDLLPNYIENLTNKETNAFVEEHLKECTECKNILENMQKEINVETSKNDGRKVKYIKKYSKKLRVLRIILLIIVMLFVIRTVRNFVIITNLSNKADIYVNSSNYMKRSINYDGDYIMLMESYYKDGRFKIINYRISLPEKKATKVTIFGDGEKTNMYIEGEGKKTALLNSYSNFISPTVGIYFSGDDSVLTRILGSITANIKSVKCNGKDCYLVNNYFSGDFLYRDNAGLYLEKNTGVIVRNTEMINTNGDTGNVTDIVADFRYEFGVVIDEDFKEPDISEYEVEYGVE